MQSFRLLNHEPGFCLLYFRGEADRRLYALSYKVRAEAPTHRADEFLTCSCDGEPDTPFAAIPSRDRLVGLPDWIDLSPPD